MAHQIDSWTPEAPVTCSRLRGPDSFPGTLHSSPLSTQNFLISKNVLSFIVVSGSSIGARKLSFINCSVVSSPPSPLISNPTLDMDPLPISSREHSISSGSHNIT